MWLVTGTQNGLRIEFSVKLSTRLAAQDFMDYVQATQPNVCDLAVEYKPCTKATAPVAASIAKSLAPVTATA
jgi:hypothetical protein